MRKKEMGQLGQWESINKIIGISKKLIVKININALSCWSTLTVWPNFKNPTLPHL